ncbi:MAG: hypothetical protein H2212_03395 [Ruminococcus sp.]|nr:hypothetical protein [Ruminococcus sp.]
MLYFHMNTSKYEGEKRALGNIELNFFTEVFSTLSDAKVYFGTWSEYPPFCNIPEVKGHNWLLESIDNESVEATEQEIISFMERAHFINIQSIGKSLDQLGLHYDFIIHISNKQVEQILMDNNAENNVHNLNEEVANCKMSLNEKITLISSKLLDIGSQGEKLTILDPYIFPKKRYDDYVDLFVNIVKEAKVSALKIITNSYNYDYTLRQSIEQRLTIPMDVFHYKNIHDRWWIVESKKKAIVCGTSLNGLGQNKMTVVNPLPQDDVETIIKDISRQFPTI